MDPSENKSKLDPDEMIGMSLQEIIEHPRNRGEKPAFRGGRGGFRGSGAPRGNTGFRGRGRFRGGRGGFSRGYNGRRGFRGRSRGGFGGGRRFNNFHTQDLHHYKVGSRFLTFRYDCCFGLLRAWETVREAISLAEASCLNFPPLSSNATQTDRLTFLEQLHTNLPPRQRRQRTSKSTNP